MKWNKIAVQLDDQVKTPPRCQECVFAYCTLYQERNEGLHQRRLVLSG